jgi:probable rRNA maturation factor
MRLNNGGISVDNVHPSFRISRVPVLAGTRILLRREGISARQAVAIIFTGDSPLRDLNRRFRKKDQPTDVLSFNLDDPDFLGEIYISLDRTREQAREYGKPFYAELTLLITHGLLHLCGYDHGNPQDQAEMQGRERLYARYFRFSRKKDR